MTVTRQLLVSPVAHYTKGNRDLNISNTALSASLVLDQGLDLSTNISSLGKVPAAGLHTYHLSFGNYFKQ